MAVITENHPALAGDSQQFWRDELDNSKILLYELDKAINSLTKKEIAYYIIDTGQDRQSVTRLDLPSLYIRRQSLIEQIKDLEIQLGITEPEIKTFQVVPRW
jgi:hypothetical protein